MVSTTSQINKFIEFIAVLGDLIILNLVLFFLLFFWEEAFASLPVSYTHLTLPTICSV